MAYHHHRSCHLPEHWKCHWWRCQRAHLGLSPERIESHRLRTLESCISKQKVIAPKFWVNARVGGNCSGPGEPENTARRNEWDYFGAILTKSCEPALKLPDHEVVCGLDDYLLVHQTFTVHHQTAVSWLEHRSVFSLTSTQVSMSNLPLFRDPWAKREAWRKSPVFSNRIMFRSFFPGFGIAVVAFTAYVIADNIYLKAQSSDPHHHWQ